MNPQLIRVLPDASALYGHAASVFRAAAAEAVRRKGFLAVALSGGSTPRFVYSLLASEPAYRNEIRWSECHFFWGDERHER